MNSREGKPNLEPSAGTGSQPPPQSSNFQANKPQPDPQADPLPNFQFNPFPDLELDPLPLPQFTPMKMPTQSTSRNTVSNLVQGSESLDRPDPQDSVTTLSPTHPSLPAIGTSPDLRSFDEIEDAEDKAAEAAERAMWEAKRQAIRDYNEAYRQTETQSQQDRPSIPAIDLGPALRYPDLKQAASDKARKDAEQVAKEVKRQAIRDNADAKTQAQTQEQKDRQLKPAPFFPSLSPATLATPQTSFTTTLAYRSASGVPLDGWRWVGAPLPPPPPPSSEARQSPSRPSERRDIATPKPPPPPPSQSRRPSDNKPKPQKGVLQRPSDGTTFVLPKPPKSVRFNDAIDFRDDSSDETEMVGGHPLDLD